MFCSNCGATLPGNATFCSQCGTPVGPSAGAVSGSPRAAWPAAPPPPGAVASAPVGEGYPPAASAGTVAALDFTGNALPLFGWALLMIVSALLVIPYPFAVAAFAEWLARNIRVDGPPELRFVGRAADIWLPTLVAAAGGWFGLAVTGGGLVLVSVLVNAVIAWWVMRVLISFVEHNGSRLRFDGQVFAYVGFQLLITISFITIIGWAWATAAMYRWIAQNVRHAGASFDFVGSGHEILWRVIVAVLASFLILPIPWVWWWVYRWIIQQIRLRDTQPDEAYALSSGLA